MKYSLILSLTIIFFFIFHVSIYSKEIKTTIDKIPMGTMDMEILITTGEGQILKDGILFVNVHDNENIAADAAKEVIKENGGKLIELHYSNDNLRYIPCIDTNRIFTDKGREKVTEYLENFSEKFLDYLKDAPLIIAVHNNSGINMEKCFTNNKAGMEQIYHSPDYESDFFLVTIVDLFTAIKDKKGFNVVLQNNDRVQDDGSLSVYCGENNIPYINIEVKNTGNYTADLDKQIKMINIAVEIGKKYLTEASDHF
jgi:hypothetical protein